MTVIPHDPTGALAVPGNGFEDTGLEDFDRSDAVVPRVKIIHDQGEFQDGLTGEKFPRLQAVILGLVKQRIMWHKDIGQAGEQPQCRARDAKIGHPRLEEPKRFPWEQSNFLPIVETFRQEDGTILLPCTSCNFADWNGKTPPLCTEQYALPLFYKNADDPNDEFSPGILTIQKTAIKPANTYITSFVNRREPMYTAETLITLVTGSRGAVTFSTPKFTRTGNTDPSEYGEYSTQFRSVRDFLHRTVVRDVEPPVSNTNTGPAIPAAGANPVPAAAPVAIVPTAAPDDPWATSTEPSPVPIAAPVASPAQTPVPQSTSPAQSPVAPPAQAPAPQPTSPVQSPVSPPSETPAPPATVPASAPASPPASVPAPPAASPPPPPPPPPASPPAPPAAVPTAAPPAQADIPAPASAPAAPVDDGSDLPF